MDVKFDPRQIELMKRVEAARGHLFYFIPLKSVGPISFIDVDELKKENMFTDAECESFRDTPIYMFGSNNYLGLTEHPEVMAAAIAAIDLNGTGCTGSRFLNGTLGEHRRLERKLAAAIGKEEARLLPTGYQSNLILGALATSQEDIIILDYLDHSSIKDGARLSTFGLDKGFMYRHNDMASLEEKLKLARAKNPRNIFVVFDGVFSMEGDLANLPEIVALAEKYHAVTVDDEAHAMGVFGKTGMGVAQHYGLTDRVDIITGTFSKSWACIGGFVAANSQIINYLTWHTSPFMFSASSPPSIIATVDKCLDITVSEEGARLRKQLFDNAHHLRGGLKDMGYNTGDSDSPIVPVIIGNPDMTVVLGEMMLKRYHVFTNVVPEKAVPKGMEMLRASVMATHKPADIDDVLKSFYKAGVQLNLISA